MDSTYYFLIAYISKDQDWKLRYQILFLDLPLSWGEYWTNSFISVGLSILICEKCDVDYMDDVYIPSSFNILRS